MAQKRTDDQETMNRLVERFLKATQDEQSVYEVERSLQLHVVGTTAYIPSYTRGVMDKNFGAPVMAIETRTDVESKTVFISPAKDPEARSAKSLRSSDTMGPAYVAFGVPLRKLKLKLALSRRVVLPLHVMEVPNEGTVYWASFAEIEKERRDIDMEAIAAAKQEKAAQKKARKAARAARSGGSAPAGQPPQAD